MPVHAVSAIEVAINDGEAAQAAAGDDHVDVGAAAIEHGRPAGLEPYTAAPTTPVPVLLTLTLPAAPAVTSGCGRIGAATEAGCSYPGTGERHGEGARFHASSRPSASRLK